jgi:uncharacterized protein YecE (DUF72 family)
MNSKIEWRIGCSGFAYKEWKEEFYPPKLAQKNWFHFYTQHFNTLELNVTFWRFPTLKSLSVWYDKAPEDFLFSAKVPRFITHFRKLVEAEQMLADFYGLLKEGLKEKLGSVLFQMPPQFQFSKENLEKVTGSVDHHFQNTFEFRHDSWWRADVRSALTKNKIAFCGVSFPKVSNDDAVVNIPFCYYRFHGVPKLFYSEYDKSFVEKIIRQAALAKKLKTAYIYFNNTASVAALHNAKQAQEIISLLNV